MSFLVFYVTHPDEATARQVSDKLLDRKLIACANIFPMTSAYWWEGAVQREGEWVSILKTRIGLELAVEQAIMKLHPYQVPCIMRFEARANAAYQRWIFENTSPETPV